jgi:hypothetical protein
MPACSRGSGPWSADTPDGTGLAVPEWMTSRERCGGVTLVTTPQVSLASLLELPVLVSSLSAHEAPRERIRAEPLPEHDRADYEIFLWRVGMPWGQAVQLTHHPENDQWPDLWIRPLR